MLPIRGASAASGGAASPAWTRHLSRIYDDHYRAHWSSCVSRAQQLLQSVPEAQREYGVWPAYYCGVMSGDGELYAASVEMIGEEEDLSDLAGGIELFFRERGEVERAEQFKSRHCVEVGDEEPRCVMWLAREGRLPLRWRRAGAYAPRLKWRGVRGRRPVLPGLAAQLGAPAPLAVEI